MGTLLQLKLDLAIAHDRAGDELRKQRVIGGEFAVAAGTRDFAPVDVDEVGDGLEGKERNADRQRDRRRRGQRMKTQRAGDAAGKLPKERGVFVITETEEIDRDADRQQRFAASRRRGLDAQRQILIDEDRDQQDQHRAAGADAVKDKARDQDQPVLAPIVNQIIQREK
jgi:hypothetical protein